MTKLDYFQKKKLNPADQLRELLDSLESRQPRLKGLNPTQALILLRDLDQAYALFTQLEASGLNLLPEQGRFKTIQTHFKQNAARLLNSLGGAVALSEYRPKPAPGPEQWWWYIHEIVAARNQRLLRRSLAGLIAVSAVLGGIVVLFNTILAPSPEAIARVEAENEAMAAFESGDLEQALVRAEEGLVAVPGDPGLLILKGIFQELLAEDMAVQTFEQARAKVDDLTLFYLGRGQMYFRTSQFVKAENDARAALELSENISTAWLLLGQALESQGREFEAIPAYQQAGDVALANGDSEVLVLARLALSRVGVGPIEP